MEKQRNPFISDHKLSYSEVNYLHICSNCKHADGMKITTAQYIPKDGYNGYCRLHNEYIDQELVLLDFGFMLEGRTYLQMDCKEFEMGGPSKFFGGIANFFGK